MLKLWGRLSSVNVQKVVWCLAELGVPYQRIEAGGKFGVVDTSEYRAMNPNGLIPVIDDGGFVLWESNAILRYLAAKNGEGTLWPTELHARASSDRWMDWQTTTFNPALGPAFKQIVRTPAAERDDALIESSRMATEKQLKILDAHLATHEYVAGSAFTIGDIPLGCSVARWMKLPLPRESHPHVERWFARVSSRTAANEVMQLPLS
jgi:glutathione S-transferase